MDDSDSATDVHLILTKKYIINGCGVIVFPKERKGVNVHSFICLQYLLNPCST